MWTVHMVSAVALLTLAACGGSNEQVYRGPDGEEVRVERGGDGTTTYRSGDGETVITTGELGGGMPADLPLYPGADDSQGFNIDATGRDGESGQIASFQTGDAPAEVIAFYRSALESGGYRITATMDMGQSQMITAEREGSEGGVHLTATDAGGRGTTVSVIAGGG